jgi:hypothetical protein
MEPQWSLGHGRFILAPKNYNHTILTVTPGASEDLVSRTRKIKINATLACVPYQVSRGG